MIRVKRRHVLDAAKQRPAGYLDAVMSVGSVVVDDGQEWIEFQDRDYASLIEQFRPTAKAMVQTAISASRRWASGNFETVTQREEFDRGCHCALCIAWDARRNQCRECGCFGLKLWLATERCPLGRW